MGVVVNRMIRIAIVPKAVRSHGRTLDGERGSDSFRFEDLD
jgi:hypothetical protein